MDLKQRAEALNVVPGYWWRPGAIGGRLPGVLRRNTEAGVWTLDVVGTFDPESEEDEVHDAQTLFGDTSGGPVTLRSASWTGSRRSSGVSHGEVSRSETWHAFSVLLGGHFSEEQLWGELVFDLPLTWHWFSPTHLEGAKKDSDPLADDFFEEFSANLADDLSVTVWRGQTVTYGRDVRERRGTGGYRFSSEQGFTLRQVEQPILAIENLHYLLYGGHTTSAGYALTPFRGEGQGETRAYELGARLPVEAQPRIPEPYFGTEEVDFPQFLPRWIDLHVTADSWPTLGPLPGQRGYLQTEVVEAVNGAEALARSLGLGKSEPTEREQAILDAIQMLPRRTREKAAKALEIARDTLAERLDALALTLGQSSAPWLLGDVHAWAVTAARVRNALSHGYASKSELEKDPDVLFGVLSSVRVVQQLAMLRAAGFTNGQNGRQSIEMLADTDGRPLVRHNNSALGYEIKYVAQNRSAWQRAH